MPRVYIDWLRGGYEVALTRGFDFVGGSSTIKPSDRVCVKPNLTYPTFRKGVMTSPEAVEAVVRYLKNYTEHITICESDSGGYNPFSISEVFSRTGLTKMAQRYGVRLVNMSYEPSRTVPCETRLRQLDIPLPTLLLDETDLFVTMPVPKMHLNTVVSLATKNQWGVIQDPSERLKLHPYFKYVIHAVTKALPKSVVVLDGRYGLNRSGPMRGDAVELNWLVVSDSIFHCDVAVLDMMGIPVERVPYLRYICHREGIRGTCGHTLNANPADFRRAQFHLERLWTDYPGLFTFKSRFLAYVGYESALAKPLHWLLYKFREPFY